MDTKIPLVSICCITYNHEQFLERCLNGFLSQQTSFIFEVLVSNDCSTDDSQIILDKYSSLYPTIIKDVSPQSNLGAIENFYYTLNFAKGKYVAFCEGDDYWIDTHKLEKQVLILENNPDFGLVYTNSTKISQTNNSKKIIRYKPENIDDVIRHYNCPAQTIVFSNILFHKYLCEVNPQLKKWEMADYPLFLWFYINSKVFHIDELTAVYRILQKSANHTNDYFRARKFILSVNEINNLFNDMFSLNYSYEELRQILIYSLLWKAIKTKNYSEYRELSKEFNAINFKTLVVKYCYFPLCLRQWL